MAAWSHVTSVAISADNSRYMFAVRVAVPSREPRKSVLNWSFICRRQR
jgi:hypothetical protein